MKVNLPDVLLFGSCRCDGVIEFEVGQHGTPPEYWGGMYGTRDEPVFKITGCKVESVWLEGEKAADRENLIDPTFFDEILAFVVGEYDLQDSMADVYYVEHWEYPTCS